jgi:hypothetical protein
MVWSASIGVAFSTAYGFAEMNAHPVSGLAYSLHKGGRLGVGGRMVR